MKLIIDANVLFASLISNGITAKLIISDKIQLYAPEFIFDEFKKYQKLISKKTHRTKSEFDEFMVFIKNKVRLISSDIINIKKKEAKEISPDPKDTVYLALAMVLECDLWSNDKKLKIKQDIVKCITTTELMEIIF